MAYIINYIHKTMNLGEDVLLPLNSSNKFISEAQKMQYIHSFYENLQELYE